MFHTQPQPIGRVVQLGNPFKCSCCNINFSHESHLQMHLKSHKPFPCKVCGKVYYKEVYLQAHLSNVHHIKQSAKRKERPEPKLLGKPKQAKVDFLALKVSGEASSSQPEGKSLFWSAEGSSRFQCSMCTEVFGTFSELTDHVSTHDGEPQSSQGSVQDKAHSSIVTQHKFQAGMVSCSPLRATSTKGLANSQQKQLYPDTAISVVSKPALSSGPIAMVNTGKTFQLVQDASPGSCTIPKSDPKPYSLTYLLTPRNGDKAGKDGKGSQKVKQTKRGRTPTGKSGSSKLANKKSGLEDHDVVLVLTPTDEAQLHEEPYQCSTCLLRFSQPSQLYVHTLSSKYHSKLSLLESSSQFQCSICTSKFETLLNLTGHVATHSTGEPKDSNSGKAKASLSDHVATHASSESQDSYAGEASLTPSDTVNEQKEKQGPTPIVIAPESSLEYQCKFCLRSFKLVTELTEHMVTHNGVDSSCRCLLCLKTFNSDGALQDHLKKHDGLTHQFRCILCQSVFSSKTQFASHLLLHEDAEDFICQICSKKCKNHHLYRAHLMQHTESAGVGNMPNKQKVAKAGTKAVCKSKQMGTNMYFSCASCSMLFVSQLSLEKHIRTHMDDAGFYCPKCVKSCANNEDLNKHLASEHPNQETHQCQLCLKLFLHEKWLEEHMMKHREVTTNAVRYSKAMMYECNVCRHTFTQQGHLELHMRQHYSSDKDMQFVFERDATKLVGSEQTTSAISTKVEGSAVSKPSHASDSPVIELKPFTEAKPRMVTHSNLTETDPECRQQVELKCPEPLTVKPKPECDLKTCDVQMLQCPICFKEYDEQEKMSNHLLVHMRSSPLPNAAENVAVVQTPIIAKQETVTNCSVCLMEFTDSQALRTHMLSHADVSPLQCPMCIHTYESANVLVNHMTTHEEAVITYS